jgi:hypothetical protein
VALAEATGLRTHTSGRGTGAVGMRGVTKGEAVLVVNSDPHRIKAIKPFQSLRNLSNYIYSHIFVL